MGKSKLDDNLNKYFSDDVKVNCFHPVNEFTGIEQFKEDFWLPLFESYHSNSHNFAQVFLLKAQRFCEKLERELGN